MLVMQQLLVILFFVLAMSYLGWRAYRSFVQKQAGCGKGCGCADTKPLPRHMIVNKSNS